MNRMKERAMRWVSAILPILLLILGMASPALAAARQFIYLIMRIFSSTPRGALACALTEVVAFARA